MNIQRSQAEYDRAATYCHTKALPSKAVFMIKRSKGSDGSVKVTFVLSIDEWDQPVSVVGDFNGWDPLAMPLRKRSNGTRSVSVELPTGGSYRFKYLADGGVWFGDSDADAQVDGEGDSIDSLLVV